MAIIDNGLARRLAEQRRAFDQTFAVPAGLVRDETINVIAIRVGDNPYMLRLSDLSGLQPRSKIVSLPSSREELLGISGVKGRITPVYALGPLLGHACDVAYRWLALYIDGEQIAFSFSDFDGLRQCSADEVHGAEVSDSRSYIREVVSLQNQIYPLIDLHSIAVSVRDSNVNQILSVARQ